MAPHRFVLAYRDDCDVIRVENAAPCKQSQEILAHTFVQGTNKPAAPVGEMRHKEDVNSMEAMDWLCGLEKGFSPRTRSFEGIEGQVASLVCEISYRDPQVRG